MRSIFGASLDVASNTKLFRDITNALCDSGLLPSAPPNPAILHPHAYFLGINLGGDMSPSTLQMRKSIWRPMRGLFKVNSRKRHKLSLSLFVGRYISFVLLTFSFGDVAIFASELAKGASVLIARVDDLSAESLWRSLHLRLFLPRRDNIVVVIGYWFRDGI